MGHLLVVSILWAFSFGLIKANLQGLDPSFVAFIRLALSFVIFAPFLRLKGLEPRLGLRILALGSVQYGLMYVLYIAAFQYLAANEVALFTLFTPLFVVLLSDGLEKKFRPLSLVAAALAVTAAAIVNGQSLDCFPAWKGFALMQGSNLCFALGQVGYRRLPLKDRKPRDTFALAYLGALLVTAASLLFGLGQWPTTLNIAQVGTLAYLGIVASGIGFFLWNVGATRTSASVLAVFNNVKIPLAIAVSLLIFGESANLVRLTIGGGLILFALWLPSSTSSIHGPCRR